MEHKEEIGILEYNDDDFLEAKRKDAILVMSFGTTIATARKRSIEAIVSDIKQRFPDKPVWSAFSSRYVIKKIKEQTGETYLSVEEALTKLKEQGFTRIAMVPVDLFPGREYEHKEDCYYLQRQLFKRVVFGTPLMYWTGQLGAPDDVREVFEAFRPGIPELEKGQAVILVGHGTTHWSNDYFLILQERIEASGIDNIFVCTIEGTPTVEDMIPRLRKKEYNSAKMTPTSIGGGDLMERTSGEHISRFVEMPTDEETCLRKFLELRHYNKVLLMPFMLSAGGHVLKDINGSQPESCRSLLETAGFEVETYLHGLGENPAMRQLFVKRAEAVVNLLE